MYPLVLVQSIQNIQHVRHLNPRQGIVACQNCQRKPRICPNVKSKSKDARRSTQGPSTVHNQGTNTGSPSAPRSKSSMVPLQGLASVSTEPKWSHPESDANYPMLLHSKTDAKTRVAQPHNGPHMSLNLPRPEHGADSPYKAML